MDPDKKTVGAFPQRLLLDRLQADPVRPDRKKRRSGALPGPASRQDDARKPLLGHIWATGAETAQATGVYFQVPDSWVNEALSRRKVSRVFTALSFVGSLALTFAEETDTTKQVLEMTVTTFKLGFGALVGLLGGKTI